MTAPKLPRRRAPHAKVSTGCYSCKKRRIKCDETRPACKRCQTAGFDCDFPPIHHVNNDINKSRNNTPFWLGGSGRTRHHRPVLPNVGSIVVPQPSRLRFSANESLYFDFFRSHVLPDLATHSSSPIDLTRAILRECLGDDAIRQSIVSIGALALANRGPKPGSTLAYHHNHNDNHSSLPINHAAWQDALTYHTRAISLFRARLRSPHKSAIPPRTILIISILFILFEVTQGNTRAVDSLTTVALSALETPLQLHASTTAASQVARGVDDDGVRGLENLLLLMTAYSGFALPGCVGQRRLLNKLVVGTLGSAVPGGVPEDGYLPVRAALTHWEAFVSRTTMWGVRAFIMSTTSASTTTSREPVTDPQLREDQARFVSQILDWEAIMRVGLARETTEKAHMAWLELLYGANLLYVLISGTLELDEMQYDVHVDRFRVGLEMMEERVLGIMARQKKQRGQQRQQQGSVQVGSGPPAESSLSSSSSSPSHSAASREHSSGAEQCRPQSPSPGKSSIPRPRPSRTSSRTPPTLAPRPPGEDKRQNQQRSEQEEEEESSSPQEESCIPSPMFSMPVLNSRLLQSLAVAARVCRDWDTRHRFLALCDVVVAPSSTWDDKATYIGSKTLAGLEESCRTSWPASSTADGRECEGQEQEEIGEGGGEGGLQRPDMSPRGIPPGGRLLWRHCAWQDGHRRLEMTFCYAGDRQKMVDVQVVAGSGGVYDYLMCQ